MKCKGQGVLKLTLYGLGFLPTLGKDCNDYKYKEYQIKMMQTEDLIVR